ncbi:MAG TPA: hypothetical protein VNO14_06860 [Blastocatellia bacterium]|nr:hypothetical protein [Blastocatellia bacterium]
MIEVNGVALTQMSYPEQFRQNGGTTTRIVSRDSRLEEMTAGGQEVEVRVFNPLTNLRSAPVSFSESNR